MLLEYFSNDNESYGDVAECPDQRRGPASDNQQLKLNQHPPIVPPFPVGRPLTTTINSIFNSICAFHTALNPSLSPF